MSDPLIIAGRELTSRLFLGTAGYPNRQLMLDAIAASGTEMVTASIRRISLAGEDESLIDLIPKHIHFLPNTAGCQTAKDAVLTAELAREALATDWIKLEVIGDRELLYPDTEELVRATEMLVAKGFTVLPYCTDDPVVCRKLADAGAAAVMPLGSPIGSGLGICNPHLLELAGAGRARCRHRHCLRCGARHGARLRRGAAQYRGVEGARSRDDGAGDARGGRGRPLRTARRPHPQARPCGAVEPAVRPGGDVNALCHSGARAMNANSRSSLPGLTPQVGFTRLGAFNIAKLGQARVSMQSIHLRKKILAKKMDARVKPAHDER